MKARPELHDLVERRAMLIGTGEVALQRQVNQTRVEHGQLLIAAIEPLHRARAVIFEDQIGGRDQPMDHRLAFLALQIHRQAALVAVEGGEKTGAETAGMVALRCRLDLDDCRRRARQTPARRSAPSPYG